MSDQNSWVITGLNSKECKGGLLKDGSNLHTGIIIQINSLR